MGGALIADISQDCLANNDTDALLAVVPQAPIAEYPDEAFAKVVLLNLQRVFTLTQRLFPLLEAAVVKTAGSETAFDDPSRVINIGSVDGLKVPA